MYKCLDATNVILNEVKNLAYIHTKWQRSFATLRMTLLNTYYLLVFPNSGCTFVDKAEIVKIQ